MENHASWLKWLMHTMTLAPLAHLAIGLPVYFILFSGSVVYAVGLCLFTVASLLPFEFIDSLALTYAVSGKLLVGFTLYHGWPAPLISVIPALYLVALLLLRFKLKDTNFSQWAAYLVENVWRSILFSLVVMFIGIGVGFSVHLCAYLSGLSAAAYLFYRICHFYVPLWSRVIRRYLNKTTHNHRA
ncbi:hypothetical protein [Photobacterium lutimaris]|uniref:Uncharacterized protein n=1 Tax=Photobacterium lutimaris TaxID=388278 RepID=A0A2T3IQ89_9GAMM|nr:hypothetical protein [Photobacterium lutimaris]PSU30520.1 hypothetical protein C9I99_23435 [Photobacterium lutimaris]TDR76086.1 hypothetical protein DFP78_10377 [Photobacterium lutimaris]